VNATVEIRTGNSTVFTSTTGTDGAVAFKLSEIVQYNVVTTYGNVTQTDVITPSDSLYYIILDTTPYDALPDQVYEHIGINVTKNPINSSAAWINVTYTDKDVNYTNSVNITVGKHNETGTFIPSANSQNFTGAVVTSNGGNVTASFIVYNYKGETFTECIIIDHILAGKITKWHADSFRGSNLPFTGKTFSYFCVFLLFIIGMQFGRLEHATGAILICGVFWLLWTLGCYDGLGESITSLMEIGGSLATIYAILVYFNDKRREEGI
jgi:hypothetical protein